MKPSVVAANLRRIASALSNSKNPSKALVARDLKKILAAIGDAPIPQELAAAFPDWNAIENSIFNAMNGLDWTTEMVLLSDWGVEPAETLYNTYGIAIQAFNIKGKQGVAVSEPGDWNVVYETSGGQFDAHAAAKAVVAAIKNLLTDVG
jgi:hypothetical protein